MISDVHIFIYNNIKIYVCLLLIQIKINTCKTNKK